jgi:hypothetical protein
MRHTRANPIIRCPRQDRTLSLLAQKPNPARELLLTWQVEARLVKFVEFYNSRRYHQSLANLTSADIYCGRAFNNSRKEEDHQAQNYRTATTAHHQAVAWT